MTDVSSATGPDAVDEVVTAAEAGPELLHGHPVVRGPGGDTVVHCTAADYDALLRLLRDDGFDLCADLCAVDYLAQPARPLPAGIASERFEVVVNLVSTEHRRRVRVRAQVPEGNAEVPSLFALYPGAEAMEREVFDLMGITFSGHPDLTRILMPDDWEGHPLRKDYSIGRIPVQFKAAGGDGRSRS